MTRPKDLDRGGMSTIDKSLRAWVWQEPQESRQADLHLNLQLEWHPIAAGSEPRQPNRDGHLDSGGVIHLMPKSRRGSNPGPRIYEACLIDHTTHDVVVRSAANLASSATAWAISGRSK